MQELNKYLINSRKNPDENYRIHPQSIDDGVLSKIILNETNFTKEDKKTNIYRNFEFFYDKLKNENLTPTGIENIKNSLNNMETIYLRLNSKEDNPQRIFETINSTGVKLTQIDLIKNYILMNLNIDEQKEIYKKWLEFESLFEDKKQNNIDNKFKEMQLFFRHFLVLKNDYVLNTENQNYFVFQKWIEKEKSISQFKNQENFHFNFIKNIIDNELIKYGKKYRQLKIEDLADLDPKLQKSIMIYRQYKSDMPICFLMWMMNYFGENNETKDINKINELIKLTNIYFIRRGLCNRLTGIISRFFPQILRSINNKISENKDIDIVDEYKFELSNSNINSKSSMPNDIELEKELRKSNLYVSNASVYLTSAFLLLEMNTSDVLIELTNSRITIEHLIPQTADEEWYEETNFTEEEYKNNVHRLGNLTLLPGLDNSQISNFSKSIKLQNLEYNRLTKANEISKLYSNCKWDKDFINERTDSLIEDIKEALPYFKGNREVPIKRKYTEDELIINGNSKQEIRDFYYKIKERINAKYNNDFDFETTKFYVNCKILSVSKIIFSIKFGWSQLKLVFTYKEIKQYDDKNLLKDMSNIGHWGNGIWQYKITNEEDMEYFFELFDISYEKITKKFN
ncbi:GmrSD restriction endonuclease domain-containing protein [Metamycoplasma hyosynoviae]|uniref:GmrSD restriction endonuclease domain-containing protein n=1 Tax=Metamycoplasma hyosynoviae TaxID=29559 RepID=UPI003081CB30